MANKDELTEDWFFGDSSAVKALDKVGTNVAATRSLDLIGAGSTGIPLAYQESFGLGEQMGRGIDYVTDTAEDVSQETVDKIIPGIAIGAGEAVRRVAAWDWRWPKGVAPKIRGAGKVGVAYTLALDASQLVQEKAREYGVKKTPSLVAGGAGAYGAYKLATKFAFNLMNNTKIGAVAGVMEDVIADASEKVFRKTAKEASKAAVTTLKGGKIVVDAAGRESALIKAQMLAKEAGEKASLEVADVIKERMGKEAAKRWDDVTSQLLKPRVATRVGKYLAKIAPGTATKLAVSAAATVIPEGVTTVLGVFGVMWTAYDIFNLMQSMPDASTLKALIFEDVPERSAEDMLIDEMGASDSLFVPQEQRMQP